MIKVIARKHLAHQYARAFLHIYDVPQQLLFSDIDAIIKINAEQPLIFRALSASSADIAHKCKALRRVTQHLSLQEPTQKLLETLLRHKNIRYTALVFLTLKNEYQKKHNIFDVQVTSVIPLTPSQKNIIETEIGRQISGTLTFLYDQNPQLIAGIRIKTRTHHWEYSIARTIRILKNRLHHLGDS